MGRLPLDINHTPADMSEALEMLRRAKNELEIWERRWNSLRWCHSGCNEDSSRGRGGDFFSNWGW
jgi:hypothetical protein